MSQTKTPESKTGRNPRVSKDEKKHLCHIHDKVSGWEVYKIRQNVCVNDEDSIKHTDGKYYCLFHLPEAEEKKEKFEKKFEERIPKIEASIKDSEKKDEKTTTPSKKGLNYDFEYVYFPAEINFSEYNFKTSANFRSATFTAAAYFSSATFTAAADFSSATFTADADFTSATFTANANFSSAIFMCRANFRSATFTTAAFFSEATFTTAVDFRSATFMAAAAFSSAIFMSRANFRSATFTTDAYFSLATFKADADFYAATFKVAAYFRSATFTTAAYFNSATFTDYAYFRSAIFNAAAYFSSATFKAAADFRSAIFMEDAYFNFSEFQVVAKFDFAFFQSKEHVADFRYSKFYSHAGFQNVVFESKLFFLDTVFGDSVDFQSSTFGEGSDLHFFTENFKGDVNFRLIYLKNYLFIKKSDNEDSKLTRINNMDFSFMTAEKPERIIFSQVSLKPSWFVGLDSRKIVFSLVDWENIDDGYLGIQREVKAVAEKNNGDLQLSYRLLAETFFNLASNSEEHNRFAQASNFRKSALECERLERLNRQKTRWNELKQHWNEHGFSRSFISESWKLIKKPPVDFVHFLYRWLSGYGEKWFRAFVWLLVIWFVFAPLYWIFQEFGSDGKDSISFLRSFGYSLQVMTLQRPEPRPFGWITTIIYGLETIFAPVQAALLALAIRRKFMR